MNKIAPIVTIFFLLAYFAVNLSCLALDLASAPNFRPTFKYFSWHTALVGAVGSIIMCFIVSAAFASIAIGILVGFICMLHLRDFPRASWGSISQALIFHQVNFTRRCPSRSIRNEIRLGSQISSLARSSKGAREVLASANAAAHCQSAFIDQSDRLRQRHEERGSVHHRACENRSNRHQFQ